MKTFAKALSRIAVVLLVALSLNASTLTTTFFSNNGGVGNFFDITSLSASPITVLGTFRVNAESLSSETITVYYKAGSFVGSESNPAAWILLGTQTVMGQGMNMMTPVDVGNSFVLGAGLTDGLYIIGDSGLFYTDGNTTVSDSNLKLTLGDGSGNPAFASNFPSGRIWNGQLDYSVGVSAAPEPAAFGLVAAGIGVLVSRRRRPLR